MASANGLLKTRTTGYRPTVTGGFHGLGGACFHLRDVDGENGMRDDAQVKMCLQFRTSILSTAEFEFAANSPEIKQFVEQQTHRFWQKGLPTAQEKVAYGYQGAEVLYRTAGGRYEFDDLLPFGWQHARIHLPPAHRRPPARGHGIVAGRRRRRQHLHEHVSWSARQSSAARAGGGPHG